MANETSGVDVLIYIKIASVLTLVGGQRGATINKTTAVIDASHKSSGALALKVPGLKDWSISGDAVIIKDDATAAALDAAWRNRTAVDVEVQYPDHSREYGSGYVTNLSTNAPHDGVATRSLEISAASDLTLGEWS